MRISQSVLAGLVVLLMLCRAHPAAAQSNKFAAIAFSPSTGSYAYAHGWGSRNSAEADAVSRCNGHDARSVVWVKNGWAALARNSNGAWATGWSNNSRDEAEAIALSRVRGGRILCWVYSGS